MQYNKDLESAYRELFLEIRKHILSYDDIIETKKERITTYSDSKSGICHLRTMSHGVDVGFLKGAKMDDKFGKLSGNGKAIRVLSLEAISFDLLDYYFQQAFTLNALK